MVLQVAIVSWLIPEIWRRYVDKCLQTPILASRKITLFGNRRVAGSIPAVFECCVQRLLVIYIRLKVTKTSPVANIVSFVYKISGMALLGI